MRGQDAASRRAALALVTMTGGAQVRLEMPAPPVAGDDGELVGLRTPEFQTRLLAPVAVRRTTDATVVMAAAQVLEDLLGVSGSGAVSAAMQAVYAVVLGDVRYRMRSVECVRAMGMPCVYRLVLTAEGTEVV